MSAANSPSDPQPDRNGPRLRIILRSHGGENDKARPAYYSKLLCLASVVRAAHAARDAGRATELVFWNDGPIPGDRLDLMRGSGEVVQVAAGSNRESYRASIAMSAAAGWSADDLIWFAEDDYLYQPWSFTTVADFAAAVPHADYLSIYGAKALDPASPRTATQAMPRTGAVDAPDPVLVDGVTWFRGVSTTSTFGVRLGVLRADRHLLRTLPYSGGAWDHTTCLTVQGRQPFGWDEIRTELLPFGELPTRQWPTSIVRGAVRSAVNLRSRRSPAHQRTFWLCDPIGAQHMELPDIRDDATWSTVAAETRAWAEQRGFTVPAERRRSPASGG